MPDDWVLCPWCESACVDALLVKIIDPFHPWPDACCNCFRERMALFLLSPRNPLIPHDEWIERRRQEDAAEFQAMLDRCFTAHHDRRPCHFNSKAV